MRFESMNGRGAAMNMKSSMRLLLVGMGSVILYGCTTPGKIGREQRTEQSVLRVGITPDYAPLIFKRGDRIEGVEADLARQLATALNRQLQFVELKWDDQIAALNGGKTDIIMAGMSVTRARQVRVDFCEPYLRNGLMASVPADEVGQYRRREDIINSLGSVGVVKGTTGEAFVQRNFPNAKLFRLKKPSDAAYFFEVKRIKMFIHDMYAIAWLVSENEGELAGIWDPLTDEDMAWAIRKGEPDFRKAVNDFLAGGRNDGTLKKILDHWIPRRGEIQWPQRASKKKYE
jgi:ABC-type amino acid transport substrate-binding protein